MSELEHDPLIQITNERLRRLGIKAVLFDLDDTFIFTSLLFTTHMDSYSSALSEQLGLDYNSVSQLLQQLNNEEHRKNGANPDNWNTVLQRLGESLRCPELAISLRHHIDAIYTDEPTLIPGSRQVLSGLKSGRFLIGEVTWGKMGWTMRKNDQTGITSFFDVIVSADISRPKNESDWQKAMDILQVSPQECLVVGDNLKGDILPALNLGAKAIALTSPCAVFREGDTEDKAVHVDKISDFWDAIQKLS